MAKKVIQRLQREIFDLTGGYIATWLPDFEPFVGDFGQIARGRLLTDGNFGDLGLIDMAHYISTAEMESFKYSHDVEVSIGSGVNTSGLACSISFRSEGAFLYHFQNAHRQLIPGKSVFFQELAYQILTGQIEWEDTFVVVDEVIVAERSTILISKTAGGSVVVNSGGAQDYAPTNFADPRLSLAFSAKKGSIFDYSGHTNTRPLFHAVKPTIKPRGSVTDRGRPSPSGPSLAKLYDHVKELVNGRDIRPAELEISAKNEDLIEAKINIGGRQAVFQIEFCNVTPDEALNERVDELDEVLPMEEVLVFED